MIYQKRSLFSFLAKPLCIVLLMVGVFGLVRLRSSIVSMEYSIGAMERKMEDAYRYRKALEAEFASLRSIQLVEERKLAMVFPDRQKVFYVKRDGGGVPYTVSLSGE